MDLHALALASNPGHFLPYLESGEALALHDTDPPHRPRSTMTMTHAYQQVEDALAENPDLTLAQIKRWLAQQYGLLVSEVDQSFRRLRNVYVYDHARREAQVSRQAKSKHMKTMKTT